MAKILTNEEQLNALKTINQDLATIKRFNAILDAENGNFLITFENKSETEKVKNLRFKYDTDDQDGERFIKTFSDIKQRIVKDIEMKAKKYRIALSDSDLEIMGIQEKRINQESSCGM